MLILFAFCLFISAVLLFWIEPLFGKMILPALGGTPSVWNTCMVFFQAFLLLGYVYAHISIKYLGVKRQALIHSGLVLLPLLLLPVCIPKGWIPPEDVNPIPWLLLLMLVSLGLPFFVISSSAPMLQKWFSSTKHRLAKDPYFLYAASNLGSLLILIGYPVFIEPNFTLFEQSKYWQYFYFLFLALTISCAFVVMRFSKNEISEQISLEKDIEKIKWRQKLKWFLLALVPSSLMLGVTSYVSTDVSPVPLIWIIPLALYLITFIIVFSTRPVLKHEHIVKAMPFVVLFSFLYIVSKNYPIWFIFFLHLLVFFICAMVCHGELAKTRPHTKYLTEFYLWMSFGGFFGGVFNALLAPVVFKELIEYPLALVLACLLKPEIKKKEGKTDFVFEAILAASLSGTIYLAEYLIGGIRSVFPRFLSDPYWLFSIAIYGIPVIIVLLTLKNSVRFGMQVGAILLVYSFHLNMTSGNTALLTERNFYGIHRVSIDRSGRYVNLYHGTTLHGTQRIDQKNDCVPMTYYAKDGPVGSLFEMLRQRGVKINIGAVGVGTGSVSCYGEKDEDWVFYEIDPSIVRMNNEGKYFTYFKNSNANTYVVFGDARLKLKDAPNGFYDLIILDAFSSDAIPVHLITREAVSLYLEKLKTNGIIAYHTSNRYLELAPIVAGLARDARLTPIIQRDGGDGHSERTASEWILLAYDKNDFGKLNQDLKWKLLPVDPYLKIWTDDYSNVFSIFNRGRF